MSNIDMVIIGVLGLVFTIAMTIFSIYGVKENGYPNTLIWIATAIIVMITTTGAGIIVLSYN